MKTAMQQLLERLDDYETGTEFIKWLIADGDFLEKEKEQILQAFLAGDERGTGNIPFNCEQYYAQTFSNKDDSIPFL